MSCTRPKYAIQLLNNGQPYDSGDKRAVLDFYNFRESLIIQTKYNGDLSLYLSSHLRSDMVEGIDYKPVIVPCGHCVSCRLAYARKWSERAMMEAFCHEQNSFLTLTLDDEELLKHGESVRIDYLQKFFKRFRRSVGVSIRYFACGEYGSANGRPHYHVILFGFYPADVELVKVNALGDKVYMSPTLNKLWPFGHIYIGDVTFQSISYVAGYVSKKQEQITAMSTSTDIKKKLPFITMSRKPGLGFEFFSRFCGDFADDFIRFDDKHSFQIPRYFMKKIKEFCPRWFDEIMRKRLDSAKKNFQNTYSSKRLDMLDELATLRFNRLHRDL